jgi:PAS domain S-box-containing protein
LSPLKAADGRIVRYVGIIDDITEQIRASAELAQYRDRLEELVAERTLALAQANTALSGSEQFTRTIADNLPDMVAYFDTELRCRFANRAALEWFGKSAAEMAGIAMFDLVGAAVYAEKLPLYKAVLAGEAQHFERAMIRVGDGKSVKAWFHFIPEVRDRRVNGFVAIANDISAIKQAELGLQKANLDLIVARDRAEAANRAKSAFLANMSHEIRTPMNAIIGLAHLIRRDSDNDLQDQRLGKMTVAAHHLLEVIDDILDLSNIESGKIDIKRADFDVQDLLVRASALVADRARAKGLELVIDFSDLPTRLAGDATRLQQALLNLLSNAVKFTEAGSIVLSGELIARPQAPLLIRFEVHDTGIGIANDSMMHIFDAFEQADTSTTRRFGGTGLGLAITRHLAQLMGGEVGAESEPGAGSRFWFSAAVHPATTVAPVPADSGWPELGQVASPMRRRILVIDDLAAARNSVASMLIKLGFEVATSAAIEPGLRLIDSPGAGLLHGLGADPASTRPFALVLVDRDLGGEDGLEIPLHVKGDSAPQFVLMSADDSASTRTLAMRAGFRAVISKPVAPGALLAMFATLKASPGVATSVLAANDPVAELRRRGASLLLAEDNPINQEVALELLRSAGLAVDLAENGVEAVALATDKAYDLILMDVQMPEMDGLAATRLIRELAGHHRTPIIALTASVFGEDIDAGIAAGMNEYLAKPVDPARLYACLQKWLRPAFATTAASVDIAPAAPAAPARVNAAATVAMAEVGERLPVIGGLDLTLALGFSGGRVEPCLRVLRQFAQIHRAGLRDLDAHLASGDRGAALHLVHSLRGAGGAVGATRLVELAAALETSFAQPLPLSRLARESALLQVELRHLVANIDHALPGAETRPLDLDDMEIDKSELDEFEKLIASADFSAAAMYRALAPRLRERFGEPARQLGDALRNFDHERALALLRLLRRR